MSPSRRSEPVPRSAMAAHALDPLTKDPAKAEAYRYDTYLREGIHSLASAGGRAGRACSTTRSWC